jgi:hypothetical protein
VVKISLLLVCIGGDRIGLVMGWILWAMIRCRGEKIWGFKALKGVKGKLRERRRRRIWSHGRGWDLLKHRMLRNG